MKYVDEYRDMKIVSAISEKIHKIVRQPWSIMEICGGQTHAIMKYDLPSFLPKEITLIHGPGCPVCVTPLEKIDSALEIASLPQVIFTSFGDMLRVPGSEKDLLRLKAEGADVRIVYSPLDSLKIASLHPDKEVVFFAVGFETTAPVNALAVLQAQRLGLKNFSILSSHVLVPPALEMILSSPDNTIRGILAAGHVCTIMGYREYLPLANKFRTPMAVTGFEPVDILQGILALLTQLEEGTFEVTNNYKRSVTLEGNLQAQHTLFEVFEVCDQNWRGIGSITDSGLQLRKKYASYDAEKKFPLKVRKVAEPEICIAGSILQGKQKPFDCKAFASKCTPEHPLGAPMVSGEGACAAYYRYFKN